MPSSAGWPGRPDTNRREASDGPVFVCSCRELERDEISMTAVKGLLIQMQFAG